MELERDETKEGLGERKATVEMSQRGDDGGRIQVTKSTARTKTHSRTNGGRS